jgi:hypothetical protein
VDLQKWSASLSAWSKLPAIARGVRVQGLTGTGCGGRRPAIFWTEQVGGAYQIVAADVSAYLK